MSLRTRIVLLMMLATFTPALLFAALVLEHRKVDIAEARHDLHVLAEYAAQNLGEKVDGTVQLLHGLSRAGELDTADTAACSAFLGGVLRRYPQYTGLLTIRPDGQLHCDSLATGRKLDLNDRGYFKRAREFRGPAFEVAFGRLTGISVLQVAFPARDDEGRLKHVVLASLDLAQFSARFARAGPRPGMEVVLWDDQGTVMARYPEQGPRSLAGSSQPQSALYRFVQDADAETAELPGPDGSPRIWSRGVLPIAPDRNLFIALGVPRNMLVSGTHLELRRALAALAVVTLLAFLGAWLLAELGIRRQVTRIMSAARRQGAGDASARIGHPLPRGELGDLMVMLDATARSVEQQHVEAMRNAKALRRSNRTLRVMSGISSAIVRVRARDELLAEACRIAFVEGRFPIVWAGLLEGESGEVRPVAWQGVDRAYVESVPRSAADAGHVVGRALQDRKAVVVTDVPGDARLVMGKAAQALGSGALAAFPLLVSGEAAGVFVLHARESDFFDEAEMKLLNALANDVAFALENIEKSGRLDYLAYYDPLTGMANRRLFLERLAQYMRIAAAAGHPLAMFRIDLERFGGINDSLGRPAGDAVLKQVAQWLSRHAGDASLVARLEGDNFAVIVPRLRPMGSLARLLDKEMAAFLAHPFAVDDAVLRVAVRAGVALFPEDGADADSLYRNAAAALKRAKRSGERFVFYARDMNDAEPGKLTLEKQLREAVEREEFVLHYQPKVSFAAGGKIVGAEALVRWNDPLAGLALPGRFMPLLEETGLIHEVGRWVLRAAVAQHLRWRAAGLAVRIGVNVSTLQLRSRGFVEDIRRAVAVDAGAAAGLELELTESVMVDDLERNIEALKEIRAMGVTIAIDDFGTGFSSLSHLSRLPVDTLKVDRSFIAAMTLSSKGLALVSTIIALAHSLKLKVVAASVETDEQARLLRLLSCDAMQGILFCEPLEGGAFERKFIAVPAAA